MLSELLRLTMKILFSARKFYKVFTAFSKLATCAVHGLMAGFTEFSVGLVREENVMIPIDMLVEAGSRKMKRKDYDWQRLISSNG